jgi:hypothetical protein
MVVAMSASRAGGSMSVQEERPGGDPEKGSGNANGPDTQKGVVMKKMLLTLTTVGVLAVPAGMALAQSDTTEPAAPVPTCVDPVHDQQRDRDRTADQDALGAQDQVRTQLQTQLRLQDGTCDADCTGDQTRSQERTRLQEQTQLADGTGVGAMHRMGEMGTADTGRGNG